jgi:hypothetical protein
LFSATIPVVLPKNGVEGPPLCRNGIHSGQTTSLVWAPPSEFTPIPFHLVMVDVDLLRH